MPGLKEALFSCLFCFCVESLCDNNLASYKKRCTCHDLVEKIFISECFGVSFAAPVK